MRTIRQNFSSTTQSDLNSIIITTLEATSYGDDNMEGSSEVEEYLSSEETLRIQRILMFGVTPAISIFGVVGNIFSIIILCKHGFKKCSNIVLIFLAFNDLAFLVGFNSIPKFLYEVVDYINGFSYSESASYFLFLVYNLCIILDYGSGSVSLTLPVLITLERLTAVFLPLKFHQIVTPRRTLCAVVFVQVFWYAMYIYMSFWFSFDYEFDPNYNISVGFIQRSPHYEQNLEDVAIVEETSMLLSLKIPPVITFVGCVVIGVKVKAASIKRKQMTSASTKEVSASSNRTTKMLLAVCAVYTVTCAVMSLPTYIPQIMYYDISSAAPSNLGKIMYQVMNLALCINSSSNFVVYVVMNKNFRDTYKSLFVGCCGLHTKKM